MNQINTLKIPTNKLMGPWSARNTQGYLPNINIFIRMVNPKREMAIEKSIYK